MATAPVSGTEIPTDIPHEGAFPPFEPAHFASQIVWLAIIFGALYYVMSRIALPRVGSILEQRGQRIEADLHEASTMQAKAEAANAAQDKTLKEARASAQVVAQTTRDRLLAETAARRKTIEGDLNTRLSDAESQIAMTKVRAMSNVESIARDAASAIVEHLTGKPADPAAIAAAVSRVG